MSVRVLDIAAQIRDNASHSLVYLVGVDGLGASGKTRFAQQIHQYLEGVNAVVATIHNDDFYLPSTQRIQLPGHLKPVGADFDWLRLREQVLLPLRSSHTAKYARYDWHSDQLGDFHEVQPQGIVLIEGVYSTRVELRDLYDFRLWVDCPRQLRLRRGLARNGQAARSRWLEDWMPAEDRYCAEHQPHSFAHAVVDGAAT